MVSHRDCLSLLALLAVAASSSSGDGSTPSEPRIEVLAVLQENLLHAENFLIRMSGTKGNLRETVQLSVRRPNLVRAEYLLTATFPDFDDVWGVHRVMISDGDNLFLIKNPNRKGTYQQFKAPEDFWQIFDPEVWIRAPALHHMVATYFPALSLLHPQDPAGFFEAARHISTKNGGDQVRHSFFISSNMELLDGRAVPGIAPPARPAELMIDLIEGKMLSGARFALSIDESEVWAHEVDEWHSPAEFPAGTFRFQNRSKLQQVDSLLPQ